MMASSPFGSPPIKKQRASGPPSMMMQQYPPSQQQPPPPQQPQSDQPNRPVAAISQRRAQLLKLAQTNITTNNSNNNNNNNHPSPPIPLSASTLMNQARSSLMAPPFGTQTAVAAGTTTTTTATTYLQAATSAGPSRFQEPNHNANSRNITMNGGGSSHGSIQTSNHLNGTNNIRQPGSALRGGGRPAVALGSGGPPLHAIYHHAPSINSSEKNNNNNNATPANRTNPMATTFAATTTTTPPSPKPAMIWSPNPSASPQSPSAAMTAAPESTVSGTTTSTTTTTNGTTMTSAAVVDAQLARRLEFATKTMTSNIPTPSRAKSAPPSRKAPPPPPPPPRAHEEPVKAVSFLPSPATPPEETTMPETPEVTKGGPPVSPGNTMHAGFTPAPPKNHQHFAGSTPFPRAVLATPTTLDKQAMLRDLQDIADTPQSSGSSHIHNYNTLSPEGASPELRLQQHLANTTKEKAEALKKVSQLEGHLANLKTENNVKFLSPILGAAQPLDRPKKQYPKSPIPKRMTSLLTKHNNTFTNHGDQEQADQEMLRAAAASVPYEYTLDDRTYVVRRPYGLASEQDLWYKVGQLNAKVYASQANVEDETSLEVATTCEDGSILNLYGSYFVRHHTVDEGPKDYENEQSLMKPLGNILYVDDNGVDQQYSLDDIWSTAMEVRSLYRTSLRAAADALLLASTTKSTLPNSSPETKSGSSTKTTVDTGMTTDPMPKVTPSPPPTAVEVEEDSSDPLGAMMRFVIMSLFRLIYFCIQMIVQCCIQTVWMLMILLGLSIVYLHWQDSTTADEMGAIAKAYTNHNGIV